MFSLASPFPIRSHVCRGESLRNCRRARTRAAVASRSEIAGVLELVRDSAIVVYIRSVCKSQSVMWAHAKRVESPFPLYTEKPPS